MTLFSLHWLIYHRVTIDQAFVFTAAVKLIFGKKCRILNKINFLRQGFLWFYEEGGLIFWHSLRNNLQQSAFLVFQIRITGKIWCSERYLWRAGFILFPLRNIPWFYPISWSGNFVKRYSFRIASGESPETMRKLYLSTKLSYQEIRWNYVILRSVHFS